MLKRVSTLTLTFALLGAVCVLPSGHGGRVAAASLTAPALYADAMGKEQAVRKAFASEAAADSLAKAVRTVITTYNSVVRLHPTSSYCDDALWRAAQLAMDAAARLKEPGFNTVAARYLKRLASEYPASKYSSQIPEVQARLARLPAAPPTSPAAQQPTPAIAQTAARVSVPAPALPPPASTVPAPAAPSTPTPSPRQPVASAPGPASVPPVAANGRTAAVAANDRPRATLLAIHRTVLPDVVRLTFDIDREVTFRQDRLTGPARIFFDLSGAISGRSLADRTVRFEGDSDVVRQVRVGQPAADTVRLVLDATGVASCSATPLYAPYRLVVDCTRETPLSGPVSGTSTPPASGAFGAGPAAAVAAKDATPAPPPTSVTAAPAAAAPRPKPLTPATFARKPASEPAPGNAPRVSSTAPASARTPVRPPLVGRATVPPMGIPSLLYARPVPVLAAPLLSGGPRVPAAVFAALAAEAAAPPSASSGDVSAAADNVVPSVPTAPPMSARAPLPPPAPKLANGGVSIARQLGLTVSRIVIDPGHGGHDPGAKGGGTTEATLVLDIALRLEKLLQEEGVEVILTRRTDDFVPLEERTAIANRQAADLFLSIHANASTLAQAQGVETYYLNFANSASAAAVAARENAVSGQPMNALPDFVKAIALNGKQDESRDFATQVQRLLVQKLKPANQNLRDLGVKQAPFVVLIGASMPSVLAEVAFITNDHEARLLKGTSYRQRIAEALFAAIQRYQNSLAHLGDATGQD